MFIRWISVTLMLLAVVATLWPSITMVESRKGRQRKGGQPKQKLKCGAHKPLTYKRINNRVGKGEFPFLADITVIVQDPPNGTISPKSYNCTGAIISRHRILTSLKCIGHGKLDKVNHTILVGSYKLGKGNRVEVKKVSSIKYDLYKSDEGEDYPLQHGLALIKVNHKIKYRLDHKNHTDTNRACFSQNSTTFPMDEGPTNGTALFAVTWVPGHHRAKAVAMNGTTCEENTAGRSICTKIVANKYYPFQEGTPLVRYKGKSRWEILGIHSRRYEPWSNCGDDLCSKEPPNFIPVYEKSMKKWIIDEVFVPLTPGPPPI